jgi:SAM-dependent methyltransferase
MIPARLRMGYWKRRWRERRDPALAWLTGANRRFRKNHPSDGDMWDDLWTNRRRLIQELAPGKSFLDLGGMYGIVGEMAFLAEQAGATRVVLFDGMDPSDEFDEKHRRNESRLRYIQGDLHDADHIASLGQFDIVWCAGVIYHSPNPLQQLMHLRHVTRERLLLGTHVIPEVPGIEQACVLYPGISAEMQATYAHVHGGAERFPGMAGPFDTTPLLAYANMWWGISPSALRSMMHYSGFEVTDEYLYSPFWIDLVVRPGGQSTDIYPALGLVRERARQRFADTPRDRLPTWADVEGDEIRSP